MKAKNLHFRSVKNLIFSVGASALLTPISVFAGTTTIFAPGVSLESGWYDVNKKSTQTNALIDFNFCWGATSATMLQYWQDSYVAAGNVLPEGTPNGVGTKEYNTGKGTYELAIFETYLDHWAADRGANPELAIPWYFSGESHNVTGNSKPTPNTGGYLSDIYPSLQEIYGNEPVFGVNMYDDDGGWSSQVDKAALKIFSNHVISVLSEGVGGLTIRPGSLHAVTLWGADLDENNLVTALYITDSDDAAVSRDKSSLKKYSVKSNSGTAKLQLLNYHTGTNVDITEVYGLTAYPIPEPSAFGLLAGTFALAFVASRRRRKLK